MVVSYARENDLQNSKPFRWTNTYGELDRQDTMFTANVNTEEEKALLASRFHGASVFKFGVKVSRSIRHAFYLNKMNGNTLWREAIAKELGEINSFGVFRKTTPDDNLSEYKKIPYHFVFDVKFDGC